MRRIPRVMNLAFARTRTQSTVNLASQFGTERQDYDTTRNRYRLVVGTDGYTAERYAARDANGNRRLQGNRETLVLDKLYTGERRGCMANSTHEGRRSQRAGSTNYRATATITNNR